MTSDDAEDLFHEAIKAMLVNDTARAIELLSQVIADFDGCAAHLAYRSFAHLYDNNASEALADASRALELDPSMLEARTALACAYFCSGHSEYAATIFLNDPGEAFDTEGHFYRLLAFALLVENINSRSHPEEHIQFEYTPISKAALSILTGLPATVGTTLKEAQQDENDEGSLLFFTVSALGFYRLGKYQDASDLLEHCTRLYDRIFTNSRMRMTRSYLEMYALAGARAQRAQKG
jgi:tetratricopeptide (TPR) repeat protein